MNQKYRSQQTFNPTLDMDMESPMGLSMTVPDQSLTIPQIIELYTRGKSIDSIEHYGVGYEDPDWDDVDPTRDPAFDIIEAKRLSEEVNYKIAERKAQRKKQIDESADKGSTQNTQTDL